MDIEFDTTEKRYNEASRDAYELVKTKINAKELDVLHECITYSKPFHQKEILASLLAYGLKFEANTISARFRDLEDKGMLVKVGRKKTTYSDISLNHYEVTEKGKEFLKLNQK